MGLLRSVCALKINRRVRAEFVDDLAARAARGAWRPLVVGDYNRFDFYFRPQFCHRGEDRGSFRAVGHAVRRILYITARKDLPVCEKNCRSDVEVRIWSVGILHHLGCRMLEFLPSTGDRLPLNRRQSSLRVVIDGPASPAEPCAIVNPRLSFFDLTGEVSAW